MLLDDHRSSEVLPLSNVLVDSIHDMFVTHMSCDVSSGESLDDHSGAVQHHIPSDFKTSKLGGEHEGRGGGVYCVTTSYLLIIL